MKPTTLLSIVALILCGVMAVPVALSYWKLLNDDVRECGPASNVKRTPEQVKRCSKVAPAGFIIPGIL